jgi:beta-phosphoglucomutase family hydrolase
MMIKGIIFDMDGVLIDSNSFHYNNWNSYFKRKFNLTLSKEEFASRLGASSRDFTEYFLKKYNIKTSYDEMAPRIMKLYDETRHMIKLKEGIKEKLAELKSKYRIALATGANRQAAEYIVTNLGVADYFDYIIAGNEVREAKPNPEIFLKAAQELKLQPNECVVIEDAELGLKAAKSAGMFAISIPDELTKNQDHSIADIKLKSIFELDDVLLRNIDEKVNPQ